MHFACFADFADFADFCRFLQIFAPPPHGPSCTRACISCTRAGRPVHIYHGQTEKKPFHPFLQPGCSSFLFCRLFKLWLKTTILQRLATRAEQTTHFFDIQSKYGRKRELLFLVCCVSLSWTVSFLGVSQE